jgi:putative thiamine transport system permease protein
LLWSHLIFVVPYVFLTLSGPYRQFDDRYSWLALSLTGRRAHSFWRIKLIILLRPILYAFATGFAVSIAQYLPTIFVGAGRFATLTTEAVALASGSDRRLMAIMALWQQLLPLIVFALATLIPVYRFRHRRAMSQTAS